MWVYLVLEFQSAPDPRMALRMLGYVAALYEELERLEEFRRGKVPAVLAVVLYNGEREWVGALDTRERIALAPGSDVEEMLPRMRFPVIDERRAGRAGSGAGERGEPDVPAVESEQSGGAGGVGRAAAGHGWGARGSAACGRRSRRCSRRR